MWKRDEAVKPGGSTQPAPAPTAAPASAPPTAEAARPQPVTSVDTHRGLEKTVNIGKSVIIKGELNGSEDLTIEGQVEGKIELRQNVLTIGPNGKIKAQVFAKSVVILGEVVTSPRPRRSRFATTGPWTATSRRRAWRSPRAPTSAAASTCSGVAARPAKASRSKRRAAAPARRISPLRPRYQPTTATPRGRSRFAQRPTSGPGETDMGIPGPIAHPCSQIYSSGAVSAPTPRGRAMRRAPRRTDCRFEGVSEVRVGAHES